MNKQEMRRLGILPYEEELTETLTEEISQLEETNGWPQNEVIGESEETLAQRAWRAFIDRVRS